jgi:cysteine-rich repeat protein
VQCGDGVAEGAEVCDDGNTYDGDGCSADCSTANCLVPITHTDIQDAVDDLACTTIYVLPGTYTETLTLDRSVTIEGVQSGTVTVDGNGGGSVVTTTGPSLTLRHLTVTGGMDGTGAGIDADGTTMVLEGTTVTGNTATGGADQGGGVRIANGTLIVNGSSIDGNTVTGTTDSGAGAGIYAAQSVVIVTAGSSVDGNTISSSGVGGSTMLTGGGIHSNASTLNIDGGSTVADNTISLTSTVSTHQLFGAGVFGMGASTLVMVSNATISGNQIDANATTATSVTAQGAGIGLAQGSADLGPGTVIETNGIDADASSVDADGAGIFMFQADLLAEGITVADNTITATGNGQAQVEGVGISAVPTSAAFVFIEDSTVSGNIGTANANTTALAVGGALYVHGNVDSAVVVASTFSGNQVTGNGDSRGGAVSVQAGGNIEFENCTLSGNTSDAAGTAAGGAVEAGAAAIVFAVNSTIASNTATDSGGAFSGAAVPVVQHSIVYDNTATTGAMCDGAMTIADVNILGPDLTGCTVDTTNQVLMDPSLGTLGDNGGPTMTHAIDDMSPAHDAGAATCLNGATPITVDQRALPRTGNCTLGSYEPQ